MKKNKQESIMCNDDSLLSNTEPYNTEVIQFMPMHVSVCSALSDETQGHNASGNEVATTYLDYIETSETKKSIIQDYDYKIVESGNIIEIYKYYRQNYKVIKDDKTLVDNQENTFVVKGKQKKEINSSYKRDKNTIYETKRRLKRLINSNIGQYETKDKFITLTFKEFLTRDEVIKSFKNFNKRLRYKFNNINYQYIAVIERGSQGTQRLHLHCLFFNLPYINVYEFQSIWVYGNVNMKALKDYKDVSSYILKYVGKTLEDSTFIPKGKKFYITSMHLKRPRQLFLENKEAIEYISTYLPQSDILYETDFERSYVGKFHYMKIKLQKKDNTIEE
ncbi:MAG: hypothetical protein RR623_08945 [Bacilli bacterium]